MAEIVKVPIDAIDVNPFRRLEDFPYVERKVEALCRSYKDVGMWEGVIARKNGNRYEIAFGHHRIEAARRSNMKSLGIIVRDLSDEEMLQFMGRENLEDYNSDFLTMLETWEAAAQYKSAARATEIQQPIDIARLLGWSRARSGGEAGDRMNDTAMACSAASNLISGGYASRADFQDMAVRSARELAARLWSQIEMQQKVGKQTGMSAGAIKHRVETIARAGRSVAREIRDGGIGYRDVSAKLSERQFEIRREDKSAREAPLFDRYGMHLNGMLEGMLNGDAAETRLEEILKVVEGGLITMQQDRDLIPRLHFALEQLAIRASRYANRMTLDPKANVRSLRAINKD